MDLQLRNSIYQCNPRCSIEKRNTKTHSTATGGMAITPTIVNGTTAASVTAGGTAATTAAGAASSTVPGRPRQIDYTASLLDKFERDRTDKHEQHRNNYLNETVSDTISVDLFVFYILLHNTHTYMYKITI